MKVVTWIVHMLKDDAKIKFLLNDTTWIPIGNSVPELWLFLLIAKFLRFTCLWGVIHQWVDNYVQIYKIFKWS